MASPLILQMHWANARLIEWLKGDMRDREYFLGLFSHVLRAERVWLERVHGRPGDPATFVPLFQNSLANQNDANRDGWLAALATGPADREIDYHLFNGTPCRTKISDILLHVATHGFHHRGQISSRASTLGLKAPDLSYISYTRGA
jgi:uncharacterized damage-inducible protein DinB